jgi:hypothetical protein
MSSPTVLQLADVCRVTRRKMMWTAAMTICASRKGMERSVGRELCVENLLNNMVASRGYLRAVERGFAVDD